MAREKIRYLVTRGGGAFTRYYWQPSAELQAEGWATRRLAEGIADPLERKVQAWTQAEAQNRKVDDWRQGIPGTGLAPKASARPARGSVNELIDLFKASRYFTELGKKTRYEYERYLKILGKLLGPSPVAGVTAKLINKDMYEPLLKAGTPAEANALMRVGRLLWNRGRVVADVGEHNPFAKLGLVALDKNGKPWPLAAIAAIVKKADELGHHSLGTFIVLNAWMGQRPADVLRLPRNPQRDGDYVVRQNKTGAVVTLPVTMVPHLAARSAAELEHQKTLNITATTLIVNEQTKQPYTEEQLRDDFNLVRAAVAKETATFETDYIVAGVDPEDTEAWTVKTVELVLKDLRHTAITAQGEAASELQEISAITGHTMASVKRILETYLRRTSVMARGAFTKRLAHERKTGAVK